MPKDADINKYSTIRTSSKTIFVQTTNDNEMIDILVCLDPSKSAGCDEISAMSIKRCDDNDVYC